MKFVEFYIICLFFGRKLVLLANKLRNDPL